MSRISLESAFFRPLRADITFVERQVPWSFLRVPQGNRFTGAEIQVPSPDPSALGDAVVTIRHRKHPHFHCSGADLHGEHGIALAEAVLGGSIVFRSLDGPLKIEVPRWSGSEHGLLRVQEKGLPPQRAGGALLVHLRVMCVRRISRTPG